MNSKIKELRISKGLSCNQMAQLIGVTKATYSKKENGLVRFSLDEAKIISDKFQETIEHIFFSFKVTENETCSA